MSQTLRTNSATSNCDAGRNAVRSLQHLADKRYRGHPQDGIILVVPSKFSQNGKLAAIQDSFIDIQAGHWKTSRLQSQPNWLVSISER